MSKRKTDPEHCCKYCDKPMKRKRYPNGRLESIQQFLMRKYCDRVCAAKDLSDE